jgi:hypothetical protein
MEFKAQQEFMEYKENEVFKDLREPVRVHRFALRRHMMLLFQKMDPVISIRLSMPLIVELKQFMFEMAPIMKLER